ncbi:MAG: RNA polymerase sigma factor [Ilyomonas sp.]
MIIHDHLNNENALLERLQNSEEKALGALMKLFYSPMYNYACRFCKDEQLVKDCIQEVFISMWQRRDSATAISSPKFYLLRAVKNKIIKAVSKNAKTINTDSLQEYNFQVEFSTEYMLIEKQVSAENAARLHKILSQLPARQKEIIYLKFYHHLDHEQIASLMNINRQSVYNLLHESLQKLKKFWQQELIFSFSFGYFVTQLF